MVPPRHFQPHEYNLPQDDGRQSAVKRLRIQYEPSPSSNTLDQTTVCSQYETTTEHQGTFGSYGISSAEWNTEHTYQNFIPTWSDSTGCRQPTDFNVSLHKNLTEESALVDPYTRSLLTEQQKDSLVDSRQLTAPTLPTPRPIEQISSISLACFGMESL